MNDPVPLLDYAGFAADLDALRARLESQAGPADVRHLQRLILWSRLAAILGYGTAWIAPNPISAALISLHSTTRWTIVAHHVSHRALDRIEGAPPRLTTKAFAKGKRRLWDWFEWFDPAAWDFEHNRLHHYRLGELADPDLPEEQLRHIRESRAPLFVKYLAIFVFMLTWKFVYYAANPDPS